MSSVDNHVVKMSFENAEFEKKVGTTLDTLKRLKDSLNFTGAVRGMEEIQNTANQVKFDSLVSGVEALQGRFSVLGEFVHNTFMNMINAAVDAGRRISDALVVSPIKEGFAEYELQMGAIQTILAGAKTNEGLPVTLDLVNQKLDELNTYADKTIYSFSDMTQNIGKFTNAGVGLEDAVAAIQGVSNVAAISGANAQQASHAMYNFAQALSSGYVKLVDWKSIETANMATVGFKDTLLQTGLAMGTLVQEGEKYRSTTANAQGSVSDLFDATVGFNDSLQNQWMTTEVLTQALKIYATDVRDMTKTEKEAYEAELEGLGYTKEQIAALEELGIKAADAAKDVKTFTQLIGTLKEALGSGWTKSWQYVIGDFEEAKKLWTDINNILSDYINKSADARNAMLKEWSENGGRKAIIDSLRYSFNALLSVMEPIKQAWDRVFPAVKAKDLITYSQALRDFTAGLILTDTQMIRVKSGALMIFTSLKWAFEGVVNVGKTVIDIFSAIGKGVSHAVTAADIAHVGELTARFKDLSERLRPSEKALEAISKIVTGIISVFRAFISVAIDAGSALYDAFVKVIGNIVGDGDSLLDLIISIGEALTLFAYQFERMFDLDMWSGGFGNLAEAFNNVWNAAKNFLNLDGVITWFKNLFNVTKDGQASVSVFSIIADVFNKVTKALADFTGKINLKDLDLGKALNLAANTVLFKKFYDILSAVHKKFESEAPKTWLKTIKETIETTLKDASELLVTFKETIIDVADAIETRVKAGAFQQVAISFALLVGSLWVLSTIDTGKLAQSIAALSVLMVEVAGMMTFLSNLKVSNFRGISVATRALIKMAAAILILGVAIKIIGSMKPEEISQSLLTVTILIGELSAVAKMMSNMDGDMKKGAGSLILFAGAILVLSKAVKALGDLEPGKLVNGMLALTILMAEMVAVATAFESIDGTRLSSAAKGLLVFAVAVRVLVSSVKSLAKMDADGLTRGLVAISILLGELATVAVALSSKLTDASKLSGVAAGLVIFSVALKVVTSAVKDLASLDTEGMAAGLLGIIVIATLLGTVAAAFSSSDMKPAKIAGISGALLAFSIVIGIMTELAKSLGAMDGNALIQGLGGLTVAAGLLTVVAGILSIPELNPVQIAAVSAGLLIFASAMAVISISLKALSTIPLAGLAVALGAIAGVLVIFGAAAVLLSGAVLPMIALAGALALFGASLFLVGAGVGIAATGFATLVGAIAAGGYVVIDILHQMIGLFGEFGSGLANAFIGFVTTLAAQGPVLVTAISSIIQTVLTAISESIPAITETLLVLLTTILTQFATYVPMMADAALQFINSFLQTIADNLPSILDSAITIIVTFIDGIASKLPDIIDSAFNLIISFINGLADAISAHHGDLTSAILNLIQAIVNAILDGIPQTVTAAGQLVTDVIDAIGGYVGDMYSAACNLVQGFIDGLWDGVGGVWDAAVNLASTAWRAMTGTLKEHSPSKLTFGGGVNFALGFINGMKSMAHATEQSSSEVAYGALTAFSETMENIPDIAYSPTISPVIDSSNFNKGFYDGMQSMNNELHSALNIDSISYTSALLDQMSDFTNTNRKLVSSINDMTIDYDRLGVSMANALIDSGIYVKMDGGKLMGYIASEVQTARHQFI